MRNDNGLDNGTIELTVRDEDRHILVVVQLLGFDGCRFAGGTYPFLFSVAVSREDCNSPQDQHK